MIVSAAQICRQCRQTASAPRTSTGASPLDQTATDTGGISLLSAAFKAPQHPQLRGAAELQRAASEWKKFSRWL